MCCSCGCALAVAMAEAEEKARLGLSFPRNVSTPVGSDMVEKPGGRPARGWEALKQSLRAFVERPMAEHASRSLARPA